jgi:hypothetical protein
MAKEYRVSHLTIAGVGYSPDTKPVSLTISDGQHDSAFIAKLITKETKYVVGNGDEAFTVSAREE